MRTNRLTIFILAGLVLGIVTGFVVFKFYPDSSTSISVAMNYLPFVFLRLIKMIIAPLVFATLVVGIAKMGSAKSLGAISAKAMGWFVFASVLSLSLGLVLVNYFEPGKTLDSSVVDAAKNSAEQMKATPLTIKGFLEHLVPTSIADAMTRNEILQIVVFSMFFGVAMLGIGERAKPILDVLDSLGHIMLKATGYVMLFAPLAVFGATTATIAEFGPSILRTFGIFMGEFYIALALLWCILILLGALVIGPSVFRLIKRVRTPILVAFSTASSEAAYPKTLEELERFGCSNRVTSFVLPLGYSFNLDGSMMYCTFAVMFIAQAYGVDLTIGQQVTMLAVLMLTSKGMAGVPRASTVVILMTLQMFNLPDSGIFLIYAIDHFLDMGRSATNVVGNSIATAVVSKWEGELKHEES